MASSMFVFISGNCKYDDINNFCPGTSPLTKIKFFSVNSVKIENVYLLLLKNYEQISEEQIS